MMTYRSKKNIKYDKYFLDDSRSLFPRAKVAIIGERNDLSRAFTKVNSTGGQQLVFIPLTLDLSDDELMFDLLRELKPNFVINTLIDLSVDEAEKDPARCRLLNHELVIGLAIVCKELGSTLIHLSTDFVFDGSKNEPYLEDNIASPINLLGQICFEAEQEVSNVLEQRIIIRTGRLFESIEDDFIRKIINGIEISKSLEIICDEKRCSTSVFEIARCISAVIDQLHAGANNYGIYNFSSINSASCFEIAEYLVKLKNLNDSNIIPIEADLIECRASRPKELAISSKKILDEFGIKPVDWEVELASLALQK